MAENQNQEVRNEEVVNNGDNNYIETIKQLKENSVSREEYDKLKSENKELLDALVTGNQVKVEAEEDNESIEDLRNKLFNENAHLSNLEYVETSLKLRSKIIAKEGVDADPFLPHGHKVTITPDDYRSAERTAQIFQECIDAADGDSEYFTNELQRRTKDVKY